MRQATILLRQQFFLLSVSILFVCGQAFPQGLGTVTGLRVGGSSLTLAIGSDTVDVQACATNIVMIDFRPGGNEAPGTLVLAQTTWTDIGASIDTTGDPIRLTTDNVVVEIGRNPMRLHVRRPDARLFCEEPIAGGLAKDTVQLLTSGGAFYGVHNRSQGVLSNWTGGPVFAGSQGQAGGPFVWTTAGWGFLADADSGSISIGINSLTFTRPTSNKRNLKFFLIVGSPKEIITGLHRISGMPPLFPKYTLGFMNTEWGIDQSELYNDIATYRSKSIPIDAYILDFDWMDWGADNDGEFRWGPKFPDGQSGTITDSLRRWGMHLMGIRKPRVHVNTTQGAYCQSHGFFLSYSTDYFSGKQVGLLDFQNSAARAWYWDRFANANKSYDKGITGYWNDEADEYGGNLMFMQMERSQYEGQRDFNDVRVWSINRNFFTGAQRYAYGLWSGDIQTGFSAMADQRLFMLSSIVLGVSWWGMDIGGFAGTPSPENYFRWIQFGAFVPVFRVHGTYGQEREPWRYGTEAEAIATSYIRLRYRLMPYIYSAAWENHLSGIPIARPLVMDYPDDPATVDLATEWMFGPSLLVSPVVSAGATQQSVYVPGGTWINYFTGQAVAGPTTITVPVTRADIPIFVKGGSIIPMSPPMQSTLDSSGLKQLVLTSYPSGTGTSTVYQDDGSTYRYEKGEVATIALHHDRTSAGMLLAIAPDGGNYNERIAQFVASVEWAMTLPDSVVLDGVQIAQLGGNVAGGEAIGWMFDTTSKRCLVQCPYDRAPHTLGVYFTPVGTRIPAGGETMPRDFELNQNFPNPFNPATTIRFALPTRSFVRLTVYNLLGQRLASLVEAQVGAGYHSVVWNTGAASGPCFCRLDASPIDEPTRSFSKTTKMIVLR